MPLKISDWRRDTPSAREGASQQDDSQSVGALLDRISAASDGERTTVAQIVKALGRASMLPNMMIVALAVMSPLSGVPLVSSICGLTIALLSLQLLAQRDYLWLPGFLMRREIATERLQKAAAWAQRPSRWFDRMSRPRLQVLVNPPLVWLVQLACLFCGASMPMLELVPFTSTILATSVFLMASGMLVRDGLFVLLGLSVIAALLTGVFALIF